MTELTAKIGVRSAGEALEVSRSRVYRKGQDQSPSEPGVQITPEQALSSEERTAVRETLNGERFMDKTPLQVYATFFSSYNDHHYHSGLNLLTPDSVHFGQVSSIQRQRQQVMYRAFDR